MLHGRDSALAEFWRGTGTTIQRARLWRAGSSVSDWDKSRIKEPRNHSAKPKADPLTPMLVRIWPSGGNLTPGFAETSFYKGNCRHLLYYRELSNFTGEAPRSPAKR